MSDRPTSSSRHLVDPELLARLSEMRAEDLTLQSLYVARSRKPAIEGVGDEAERAAVTVEERLVPSTGADPAVRVLVHRPSDVTAGAPMPAILWVHGGGFVLGSADDDDAHCRMLAARTGALVVAVDYRLAPETTQPGLVDDCYAALRWLHRSAAELGVDPARIVVSGASAGGGLAACTVLLARDRGEVPVSAQFLIYPMLDDRTGSTVDPAPYVGEFGWSRADNRFGWAAHLGAEPGGADVSPHVAAARAESLVGLPPTFICVGALDLFVAEDMTYAARLIEAGVPTELHVYPGAYHGFDGSAEARVTAAYLRDYVDAIERHFEGAGSTAPQ